MFLFSFTLIPINISHNSYDDVRSVYQHVYESGRPKFSNGQGGLAGFWLVY